MANEEARMRQALGLRNAPASGQVAQRREGEQRGRRFVKDGEVPVVVVNSSSREADSSLPVNRIAAAETAARIDRQAREHAERALAEAQTALQHIRTQYAHAEMAHREAIATERRLREQAELGLREAIEARAAAEARIAELETVRRPRRIAADTGEDEAMEDAEQPVAAEPERIARRRGRPPKVVVAAPAEPDSEPEPVQWWLPTYRAVGRKR